MADSEENYYCDIKSERIRIECTNRASVLFKTSDWLLLKSD